MQLTKLQLTNFRNHTDTRLKLSPLTVLVGPNGTGKTNVIEAISLLSTTRSYRTSRDRQVINWQSSSSRIAGEVKIDNQITEIAIAFTTEPAFTKTYLVNKAPRRALDLLGILQTVLFSPESLDLIYGSPALRRRFLDILLCQVNHRYTKFLWQYNQVVKERNHLLSTLSRGLASPSELVFWDNQLIELGSAIILERQQTVDFINHRLPEFYKEVSGQKNTFKLIYSPSVAQELFSDVIKKEREREIRFGVTLFGPHRDDLTFTLDNHPLATHGSRGEIRSAVLSLKMAEVAYHNEKYETSPILLLDDIFSELDIDRRARLSSIVSNQQTIITTTDLNHLTDDLQKKAQIITLPILSPGNEIKKTKRNKGV